jgi:hypothetical protein
MLFALSVKSCHSAFVRFQSAHHTLLIVGILASAAWTTAYATDEAQAVSGKWRFVAALDASEITSLDEMEAQQLVGQVHYQ